jgi:hypothetical protein
MDIERYFAEIVDPTITDFEKNPTSARHAFLACVVTFHCIDFLALRHLRQKFQKHSEFAIVDRVAHAAKHVKTGHPKNPHNQPLTAVNVVARPPAVAGVMVPGLSRPGDAVGGVTIWSEAALDLLAIVKRAAEFLRGHIPPRPAVKAE